MAHHITEHWGGWDSVMAAKRLKVLDLAFCNYLRCTPDLSAFTLLEILILKHCDRMEQLHPSIGRVNSLVSLDLSDWQSQGDSYINRLSEEAGETKCQGLSVIERNP